MNVPFSATLYNKVKFCIKYFNSFFPSLHSRVCMHWKSQIVVDCVCAMFTMIFYGSLHLSHDLKRISLLSNPASNNFIQNKHNINNYTFQIG